MFTKNKDFLYCLGVTTLFVFAIYFAYAVLKGSGEGIQKILGNMNVREGFKPKLVNSATENLEKEIDAAKKMDFFKTFMNMDDTEGFDELRETVIDLCKINREMAKNKIFNSILMNKGKKVKLVGKGSLEGDIDQLIKIDKLVKILEENEDYDI